MTEPAIHVTNVLPALSKKDLDRLAAAIGRMAKRPGIPPR